ncbi:cytosine deaminase [Ethanoligenens sp.]|uniref:cytosine deaminase n=1 Tax=Ethanoligenens sp. TaxID=2099655 RepID=UPI0039EB41E6
MLVKNARLRKQEGFWQIHIQNGMFQQIAPTVVCEDTDVLDVDGKLVLPPFVEPHIHLDCVYTAGEPRWNQSGTLFEGIALWEERKQQLTKEDVKSRAWKAIRTQITHGVQFIRSHVDVTDPSLTAMRAMLEVKEEVANLVDLQLVAFPQDGILSFPNGLSLLEEAVKMGADCVGGIPHYEFTRDYGVESLKKVFEIAQKYDKMIDVHCDEIDDGQSRFLEVLAAEAYRLGMGARTTASHAVAMHSYNNAYAHKLFRLLRLSKINIVSCPTENTHLQGRFDTFPKRRGITRVKDLMNNGVNVCIAQDSIMDPWYPIGTGNPMREIEMCIHMCHLMGYEEMLQSLDLVTENGAKALNLADRYGVEEGKPANFIVVDADNAYELIRDMAPVLYSVRQGKMLMKRPHAEPELFL